VAKFGNELATGTRRLANWKIVSEFVNMGKLLLFGACPGRAERGKPNS
jgi:hypothetical protein